MKQQTNTIMTNLTELNKEVISYCKNNYPNCGGCGLSESCLVQIPITEHHINKNTKELNEKVKGLLIIRQ